jgi:hypothetical protein
LDALEIFVFSYDRGAHLAWCLDSIARLAPGTQVTIVDDRSTDPAVATALTGRDLRVIRPETRGTGRHGGLYPNMQRALDAAEARFALFVQDDCQMIRPLDAATLADLDRIFAAPDQMAACPTIPMGPRQARRMREWVPTAGGAAFHYAPARRGSPTAQHFTDISILDVPKLRAVGWRFEGSEGACARALAGMGAARLAHLARPLVAQLPEVPTTRFGRRTLGARLTERLDGPEMRGFHDLGPEEVARLARPDRPPLAEEGLRPTHPGSTRPFIHKAVNRRVWTRALNTLELRARGGR